jgi:hypothetical protein
LPGADFGSALDGTATIAETGGMGARGTAVPAELDVLEQLRPARAGRPGEDPMCRATHVVVAEERREAGVDPARDAEAFVVGQPVPDAV